MKRNVLEASFMKNMIKVTHDMWLKGWDERNGGNVTYRIKTEDVEEFVEDVYPDGEYLELGFDIPNLAGEYFLVKESGKST